MSDIAQLQDAQEAATALEILAEAWSYYMPEALPAQDAQQETAGYTDYYCQAA